MDIFIIFGIIVACFTGGLVGGFVSKLLIDGYGYGNLEKRIYFLERGERSIKGTEAAKNKKERLQQAISEGMEMIKEGKEPKDVLVSLGLKYPDIAMDLIKNGGLSNLGNLGGLLSGN